MVAPQGPQGKPLIRVKAGYHKSDVFSPQRLRGHRVNLEFGGSIFPVKAVKPASRKVAEFEGNEQLF